MSEASELIAKGLIMDNPTLLYLSLGEAKQKDIDGILKVYGHEWYLELLDLLGALFKKDKGDFIKSVISLANTPLIPDNINSSYNINGDELQKLKVIAENEKVVKNPPIDLIDISIKLLNNYFHLQDSEICCVQLLDYFVIKI
ncbi:MAG: hypothetical protein JRN10_04735 [Nitrososphaerota archaeon]|nr:hypothetical protein [Nitrososphaerota archaeon]MDG6930530.1 hypothetical protein [Nitrososphaerota archaeon]